MLFVGLRAYNSELSPIRSLAGLLPRLPGSATRALSEALAVVQATAIEAVAAIFKAEVEVLEDRILRMHTLSYCASLTAPAEGQDGGAVVPSQASVVNTSLYIQECVLLIASFRQV